MSEVNLNRSPELLSVQSSRLVIIDVQERLLPVIASHDTVLANCVKLLKGAACLGVPTFAAEQYPKGLGPTVEPIAEFVAERSAKMRFSASEAFDWVRTGSAEDSRHQVVLAGIETHVCVLQTALDLLTAGFDVYVVVDAIGTRFAVDHEVGLRRLADAGVRLVTTEMALFEWCEVAGTDVFKQLSKIVTGR